MSVSAPRVVPLHLRRFVVEQDYSQYNAVDQAVWRFVLKHTHARLVDTAHPAYRAGLAATGIRLDRIPSIQEMNERLSRFGWAAVCVDGFLPPRAFQSFQAERILPIAGEIRTRAHLVYTPAPDIIHEASGHAPILTDPVFSEYVQRMGWLGRQAFTSPSEDAVYRAIYTLSAVKEDPASTPSRIAEAESELARAQSRAGEPSEAARLSRLYWWTAEYGLVGRPDAYKIYGAGLLSSLWESYSCHDPAVQKRVLDETCMDVPYDITRTQPVLFVVPSFEALHTLLDRVQKGLAAQVGGEYALERALKSAEPATLEFSSGARVLGTLVASSPNPGRGPGARLSFRGPVRVFWARSQGSAELPEDSELFVGRLSDGRLLEEALPELTRAHSGRRTCLEFEGGCLVRGRFESAELGVTGRLLGLRFCDVELSSPGTAPRHLASYRLLALGELVTARAGADADLECEAASSPARADGSADAEHGPHIERVPKPRQFPVSELRLQELYGRWERVRQLGSQNDSGLQLAEIQSLHAALAEYPNEWLLRLQLLEEAVRFPELLELEQTLRRELERLELVFERREPIETGLRQLVHAA